MSKRITLSLSDAAGAVLDGVGGNASSYVSILIMQRNRSLHRAVEQLQDVYGENSSLLRTLVMHLGEFSDMVHPPCLVRSRLRSLVEQSGTKSWSEPDDANLSAMLLLAAEYWNGSRLVRDLLRFPSGGEPSPKPRGAVDASRKTRVGRPRPRRA